MPDNKAAQFDDELLSAYLDDELAPEERARVE
jgi:anti-sigma factor RsiW